MVKMFNMYVIKSALFFLASLASNSSLFLYKTFKSVSVCTDSYPVRFILAAVVFFCRVFLRDSLELTFLSI